MRKIIRENKAAFILLIASLAAGVSASAVFFITGGDNLYLFLLMGVSFVWLYFQLRAFMKILGEYEWENPVTVRIKKNLRKIFDTIFTFLGEILAPIIRKLKELADKLPRFQLPRRRKTNRLTLFQDERTRMSFDKKHNLFHKIKWKNLQSHRERIRFIYISFLQQKIKKGAVVLPSDTPNELAVKLKTDDDLTVKLCSLYNVARYADADTFIEKEDVEKVLPCASKRLRLYSDNISQKHNHNTGSRNPRHINY